MIIKSLKEMNFDLLFVAFSMAFQDYEMQLNEVELRRMLNRRGFNANLSFAAFDNEKIIAFTFNGIGEFNGVKTAYDTGTGTLKEYRGKGLATEIFNHSIPFLKDAGVKQYLLEVLQHNTAAVSVYKKLGFKISREFNYFIQENDNIKLKTKEFPKDYKLHEIDLLNKDLMSDFWDFTPSWQNSYEAINSKIDDFKIVGVFKEKTLIGYCIFEFTSGDITQIAVDKNYRRKGIASNLLKAVLSYNKHNSVKAINYKLEDFSSTDFFESNNIILQGKQYEMIKEL
ncbi:MAG: GNAT family N-acetyltransferase [Saprospiraceae bacterium]|nr:GNAT family N-acetyltransferase [Saprospiraceae bacterium]